MIRSAFRFVVAVSLLLFLATIVLWVRGQWVVDHFWLIHGDDGSELIRSAEGRLALRHTRPNGRSRITFPRRVSHWSCRVGSQLPPTPSPLHWDWRFINYDGTPAATPFEVRSARAAISDAAKVRADLGLDPGEWERTRTHPPSRVPPPSVPRTIGEVKLIRARYLDARARELLKGTSYWEWSVPAWLVAAVTAVTPALGFVGWRRRYHIRREGRCPGCGYDLRASPKRCPECGLATGAGHIAAGAAPMPAPADAVSCPRTA